MSVLVVLGLVWAAVLIPPILRARAERRAEFIDSFRHQMGALGDKALGDKPQANHTPPLTASAGSVPRRRRVASPVQRRRDILGGLLGAMIGSLVLGAIPRLRLVWVLHLFLLNLFIGYLALLAHQRSLADRRLTRSSAVAAGRAEPVPVHRRRVPEPALAPAFNPPVASRR